MTTKTIDHYCVSEIKTKSMRIIRRKDENVALCSFVKRKTNLRRKVNQLIVMLVVL
ncbi:hypothetical protein Bhyg_17464 [Pseudolycoriella hygida]|uniref:Uncharacterized protein n=1 Tax=Pseudolycoriella hygida TaxID=35572 RepID=A0A9Q0MPC9_9DIPT|nr:hypothetical protein Bhyg_17464 [Pseudolycoriella hygida]